MESTQFAESMFEGSGVIEFANHLASSGDRRQSPHAYVDADSGVGLGNAGLLGASDTHPHGRNNALSLARDRHRQDFRSIKRNQPFDASGVFVRA